MFRDVVYPGRSDLHPGTLAVDPYFSRRRYRTKIDLNSLRHLLRIQRHHPGVPCTTRVSIERIILGPITGSHTIPVDSRAPRDQELRLRHNIPACGQHAALPLWAARRGPQGSPDRASHHHANGLLLVSSTFLSPITTSASPCAAKRIPFIPGAEVNVYHPSGACSFSLVSNRSRVVSPYQRMASGFAFDPSPNRCPATCHPLRVSG